MAERRSEKERRGARGRDFEVLHTARRQYVYCQAVLLG
jgi:hypothetical protein